MGQWMDTILASARDLRDGDLTNETVSICQFVRSRGEKLDTPARVDLARRLKEN